MPTPSNINISGPFISLEILNQFPTQEIAGQASQDFGLDKNAKLDNEIANTWGLVKAYWQIFQVNVNKNTPEVTRIHLVEPILELLAYQPVLSGTPEMVGYKPYAITHRTEEGKDKPPLHIVEYQYLLDKCPPIQGQRRISPHNLMQDYLNNTEHVWGIITNGYKWRLLRDCNLMSRPCYLQFDLEQIINSDSYAEFNLFYRLFHRTRLPQSKEDKDCLLEYYYQQAIQVGGRVRE